MALKTDAMVLIAVFVLVVVAAIVIAFMTPQGQQIIGAAGGGLVSSVIGFFTSIWNGLASWISGIFKFLNPANWHL